MHVHVYVPSMCMGMGMRMRMSQDGDGLWRRRTRALERLRMELPAEYAGLLETAEEKREEEAEAEEAPIARLLKHPSNICFCYLITPGSPLDHHDAMP